MKIVDGKMFDSDVRQERIAAGTLASEHMVPRGLASAPHNAVIDDQNPLVVYARITGAVGNDFTGFSSEGFTQNGTQMVLGGVQSTDTGMAATMNFSGTSIGVLGATNPYSGIITINIDGVATPGRIGVFGTFDLTATGGANIPAATAIDSTLFCLALPTAFPASGTILVGSELITYSGIGSGRKSLTGCTRGTGGTAASAHYAYETIYLWASSIDLSTTADFATKRLVYYNPFLSPGPHQIVVYTSIGASGYSSFYFDGFTLGSLIGAKNLFTQMGSITVPVTTDANGHTTADIQFAANNFDISPISILGYSQSNTTTSNTTLLGKLGTKFGVDGQPRFYLHNGPPSASFDLTITFMYIGESLS